MNASSSLKIPFPTKGNKYSREITVSRCEAEKVQDEPKTSDHIRHPI